MSVSSRQRSVYDDVARPPSSRLVSYPSASDDVAGRQHQQAGSRAASKAKPSSFLLVVPPLVFQHFKRVINFKILKVYYKLKVASDRIGF
jgi:hypothetical protein